MHLYPFLFSLLEIDFSLPDFFLKDVQVATFVLVIGLEVLVVLLVVLSSWLVLTFRE
jgi:hypothetical protein